MTKTHEKFALGRDLPPLNAVRMFEVAAQTQNFTTAAEYLHVTQGAVSRQIKNLEADLQAQLFERDGSNVRLTESGERFYRSVKEGLDVLRSGTESIRRPKSTPVLNISVLPSFAAKWLVSRIVDFQREHQNIELRIAASYDLIDFSLRPDIDAGIRFGQGNWKNVYKECLISEQTFPVCSPEFLENQHQIRSPEDLLDVPLIYAGPRCDEWSRWFEAAGVTPPNPGRGPRYSDELMLHQAAIRGQGVTLARSLLVSDELESGRLVRLFDLSIESTSKYYFVCLKGRESEGRIAILLDWLRQEALKTNSACENLYQVAS